MNRSLGDIALVGEVTPKIIVCFGEGVAVKEFAERSIECGDSLPECHGVGVESVLRLIEAVGEANNLFGIAIECGVVARNKEYAENKVCERTDR